MGENDFKRKITAEVPAEQMRRIYLRLEDEARPHAVRVSKCRPYVRKVTIYCDAEHVAYFNKVVVDENKTEI